MSKYINGLEMDQFTHIPGISRYNYNYYVGFEGDLLFGKSNDDNCTEWYKVYGDALPSYLGYSLCTDDDILQKGRP